MKKQKKQKTEKKYIPELINSYEMHMGFKNMNMDYYPDKEKRIDKRTKKFGNPRKQIKK